MSGAGAGSASETAKTGPAEQLKEAVERRASRSASAKTASARTTRSKTGTLRSPRLEQLHQEATATNGSSSSSSSSSLAASMKRTASAASSSSLSSVPESPPKKKQKGKGKDKGVTEGVDAGSEADEEVVTARPAPQAASKVPASKTAQKFVGIVVPRVPSKKKPNKSPSPAPRHSLSPVPPSKHSSPSPKRTTAAHVASDSDDDLADADELLATLINASKPSPKKAKKSVSFHDLPGADASGGSGLDEDRAVRRSVRVVENETRPKASASKGPLGSNFTSASSGAGKFSLKALARAAKKEDRIEKAVEEALQYELPDQVPDDLLRSPSRRDLPTTPPPQSQSQEGYAFINPVATPTASPRKTRVNASDLQALDRMDSLVAPSSSARATADEDDDEPEDEDEVAERRKLAKKTADLVRRDATGGDAAAESEEMQRAARTCWVTDAEATGTLDGRWEEVLEDAEDADEVAKVVVDVLKDAENDWTLIPLDLLSPSSPSSFRLVLQATFHPTTPPRLADRLVRVLYAADPPFEFGLVVEEAEKALGEAGFKGLAGEKRVVVGVEARQGIAKRIARVVGHAAASSSDYDGQCKILPTLIRLALDPLAGTYRSTITSTIQNVTSRLLASQPNEVFDVYRQVMEGETFRFQVELVRLVLGDQEKARAFKSWLALVALRPEAASELTDPLTPPSVALALEAVCQPSSKASPIPSRSTILRPTYLPAFDATSASDRELGCAVGLLQTAVRDLGSHLDGRQEVGRQTREGWRGLANALGQLDHSIRTSIRGDPERYKAKNSITRLVHRLEYDLKDHHHHHHHDGPGGGGTGTSSPGSVEKAAWATYDGSAGPLRRPRSQYSREQSAA